MKKLILLISFIILITSFSCNIESKKPLSENKTDKEYVSNDDSVKNIEHEKIYALVTTVADGMDIKEVNIWSSVNPDRVVVGRCKKNEKVQVLSFSDPYVKIKKQNGIEGWFMEGWIKEYVK